MDKFDRKSTILTLVLRHEFPAKQYEFNKKTFDYFYEKLKEFGLKKNDLISQENLNKLSDEQLIELDNLFKIKRKGELDLSETEWSNYHKEVEISSELFSGKELAKVFNSAEKHLNNLEEEFPVEKLKIEEECNYPSRVPLGVYTRVEDIFSAAVHELNIMSDTYDGTEKQIAEENKIFESILRLGYNYKEVNSHYDFILKATTEERLKYVIEYILPNLPGYSEIPTYMTSQFKSPDWKEKGFNSEAEYDAAMREEHEHHSQMDAFTKDEYILIKDSLEVNKSELLEALEKPGFNPVIKKSITGAISDINSLIEKVQSIINSK